MQRANDVSLLFDRKAPSWNGKYKAGGPLAFRVAVFSSLLTARVEPGASVLDFGGGTGAIASALALRGYKMTVCDISEQMILAGKRINGDQLIDWRLLPKDWTSLPFAAHAFDGIVASSVFEYLDDAQHALQECSRVLRPGGKLIFSVPNPAHPSRRLEQLLRSFAPFALAIPGAAALPKIGGYLKYLQVSHRGMPPAEWVAKASRAQLQPVRLDPADTKLPNKALTYFVFERLP